jgi:hypothetical protein
MCKGGSAFTESRRYLEKCTHPEGCLSWRLTAQNRVLHCTTIAHDEQHSLNPNERAMPLLAAHMRLGEQRIVLAQLDSKQL